MFSNLNEAQRRLVVYGLLAVLGPCTARHLASLIGEQPQGLYVGLESLVDMGLVIPAGEHYRVTPGTPQVKIENGELVVI